MRKFIRSILKLFRPKIKVSYYKLVAYFDKAEGSLRPFIELANVLKFSPEKMMLLAASGKYLEGLALCLPDGRDKMSKKEMKYILRTLKDIEGIRVNVVKGLTPYDSRV